MKPEAAAQLGAVLASRSTQEETALAKYGIRLGTAFQLVDDMLDYSGSTGQVGKNIGDDLAEGKPTLPLIYAMRHGNPEQAQLIRQAIQQGGRNDIDHVTQTIESSGAIAYTARLARQEADLAITALTGIPESPYKEALIGLAEFSVNRNY